MAAEYTTPPHSSTFETWCDYRDSVRAGNGGRLPSMFRTVEDAMVCYFSATFGVGREVFDAILTDPEIFDNLGLFATTVQHNMVPITAVDVFYEEWEEVEEMGGAEEFERRRAIEGQRRWEAAQAKIAGRKPKGPTRYWLYRIFGADDRLLYIGVTRNPEGRERAHRKKWGDVIERVDYEEFTSHDELLATEARLIAEHNPPFNAQHVGGAV